MLMKRGVFLVIAILLLITLIGASAQEEITTIEGTTEVVHVDDFQNPENSRYDSFINTGQERYKIMGNVDLPEKSNVPMKLTGNFMPTNPLIFQANEVELLGGVASGENSLGEKKMLVLLLRMEIRLLWPFKSAII